MFHLLFEVRFLPFFEHRFLELHLVFSSCRVLDQEAVRCAECSTGLWTLQMSKNTRITSRKVSAHALMWRNVGWFHQHNKRYNILTSLMLGISQSSHREVFANLCKPIDIMLVFTTFKIKNLFNVKDAVPEGLHTRVVYKFLCTSCNACYVGETSRHFSTWVREHLLSDRSSNVFRHLQSLESCRTSCTPDCFQILNSGAT